MSTSMTGPRNTVPDKPMVPTAPHCTKGTSASVGAAAAHRPTVGQTQRATGAGLQRASCGSRSTDNERRTASNERRTTIT